MIEPSAPTTRTDSRRVPLPELSGRSGRHPPVASETYGALKSKAGPRCRVDFFNRTDVELRVLWLNFEGKKVQYGVMPPGGHYVGLRTFTTHPWVLEDWNGTVYALYVGGAATVTVNGRDSFTVKSGVNRPDTAESQDSIRTRILTLLNSRIEAEALKHEDAASDVSNGPEHSAAENAVKRSGGSVEDTMEEGRDTSTRGTKNPKQRAAGASWLGWCLQSKKSLQEEEEEEEQVEECQAAQKSASKEAGNSGHTCPICCDSLEHDVWALACGHMLHGSCLAAALERGLECPVCRQAVAGEEDLRRLYPS